MHDPYQVLDVLPTASAQVLARAYRRAVRDCHPDRHGARHLRRFREVVEAYRLLGDATRRAFWDRFGRDGTALGLSRGQMEDALRASPPEPATSAGRRVRGGRLRAREPEPSHPRSGRVVVRAVAARARPSGGRIRLRQREG